MPDYLPFVLIGLLAAGLLIWKVAATRRRHGAQKAALELLGFSACPDQKNWLEEIVTRIQNDQDSRYEVRDPKRLEGKSPVYYYVKIWDGGPRQDSVSADEEILFSLKRTTAAGLVLIVKPSSLAPGLATRLVGTMATGPWDAQPDDLHRLELPPDLKETNLLGALGPPGANLYDLIDTRTLSVVQGMGDAGGMFVRFRDTWCSVEGTSEQVPFRLDELVARIRPLL